MAVVSTHLATATLRASDFRTLPASDFCTAAAAVVQTSCICLLGLAVPTEWLGGSGSITACWVAACAEAADQ